MLKIFVLFAVAVIATTRANPRSTRQGAFNLYYIYNSDNSRVPVPIDLNDLTTAEAALTLTKTTVVVVHGHRGSATTSLNPQIKDFLLTSDEELDVIVVDWSIYASQTYATASSAVPSVGFYLANLITDLSAVIEVNNLHLVGFDLGAHVVGFAGRALNGAVARITGLNPAGSLWNSNTPRLRSTDARYVEVIHTDGNGLLANGIGEALGHVDFFANGGSGQPGCLLNNDCSHNRAWELFAASLVNEKLIGNQCGSMLQVSLNTCRGTTLVMGNNQLNKIGSGIYRVNTKRTFPY